jgi:hypothetical protein
VDDNEEDNELEFDGTQTVEVVAGKPKPTVADTIPLAQ